MTRQTQPLILWARAARLHQWLKNFLIFVPLLSSHRLASVQALLDGLAAFVLFGMCASSAYMINDLRDIEHDRLHASKRLRPFASGQLPVKGGVVASGVLLLAALAISTWVLPWQFTVAMGVYYAITIAYSLFLKRLMMLDVVTLAMLYTLRIVAGVLAFKLVATFWMLAFSMFMFLSLALVKRHTELADARSKGEMDQTRGRGYFPGDLQMISGLGAASGYIAVMVLALYIQDPNTAALYRYPSLIWLACPLLLYWISRVWMLTHRGAMHEDPVVFAIRDPASLSVGALFGLVFWLAA